MYNVYFTQECISRMKRSVKEKGIQNKIMEKVSYCVCVNISKFHALFPGDNLALSQGRGREGINRRFAS